MDSTSRIARTRARKYVRRPTATQGKLREEWKGSTAEEKEELVVEMSQLLEYERAESEKRGETGGGGNPLAGLEINGLSQREVDAVLTQIMTEWRLAPADTREIRLALEQGPSLKEKQHLLQTISRSIGGDPGDDDGDIRGSSEVEKSGVPGAVVNETSTNTTPRASMRKRKQPPAASKGGEQPEVHLRRGREGLNWCRTVTVLIAIACVFAAICGAYIGREALLPQSVD